MSAPSPIQTSVAENGAPSEAERWAWEEEFLGLRRDDDPVRFDRIARLFWEAAQAAGIKGPPTLEWISTPENWRKLIDAVKSPADDAVLRNLDLEKEFPEPKNPLMPLAPRLGDPMKPPIAPAETDIKTCVCAVAEMRQGKLVVTVRASGREQTPVGGTVAHVVVRRAGESWRLQARSTGNELKLRPQSIEDYPPESQDENWSREFTADLPVDAQGQPLAPQQPIIVNLTTGEQNPAYEFQLQPPFREHVPLDEISILPCTYASSAGVEVKISATWSRDELIDATKIGLLKAEIIVGESHSDLLEFRSASTVFQWRRVSVYADDTLVNTWEGSATFSGRWTSERPQADVRGWVLLSNSEQSWKIPLALALVGVENLHPMAEESCRNSEVTSSANE